MYKFIFCSFLFLAWGFWELSGGSDFEPPVAEVKIASALSTYDVPAGQATRTRLVTNAPSVAEQAPAATVEQASLVVEETAATAAPQPQATTETYSPEVTLSAVPEPTQNPEIVSPAKDIRSVNANRLNMRNGPSTSYSVLAKLNGGDEVEILQVPGDGWVKLRVIASGQVGWTAERFLTPKAN